MKKKISFYENENTGLDEISKTTETRKGEEKTKIEEVEEEEDVEKEEKVVSRRKKNIDKNSSYRKMLEDEEKQQNRKVTFEYTIFLLLY